jgi:TRAP-type uncharacterized transport system substrate-binding protein
MHALPPRHLVIETGPAVGSYYRVAEEYAKRFAALGITLELRPRDDSLALIADVNNAQSDVDIGFIAQAVRAADYPNVTTLGSITYQPLFIFYRKSLGELTKPAQLKGLRLDLLAEGSATSAAATAILNAHGISQTNTTLRHDKLLDAADALKAGTVDAACFVLAADSPLIAELMSNPDLRLMNLDHAAAIAQRFPFLKPLTIAQGAYDLQADLPPAAVSVVAATVDVIVKQNLPPAIVYALMQFMMDLRSEASGLAKDDEFPAVRNAQLPVNAYALVYYQSGLPWVHRELPLIVASLADTGLIYLLPLFVMLRLTQSFGVPRLPDLVNLVRMSAWMRVLRSIERDVNAGKQLTQHQVATLRAIDRRLDPARERKHQCIELTARIREKYAHGLAEHPVGVSELRAGLNRLIGLIPTMAGTMPSVLKRS